MSFFEEIPEPETGVGMSRHRRPEWAGPPENAVGATVPVDLVLANTGELAVTLGRVSAYPTGVRFEVEVLRRTMGDEAGDPFVMRFRPGRAGGFRFGVELPDGFRLGTDGGGSTERAMLTSQGGGGGGLSYAMDFWLWPLPGEGTLRVACVWPEEGLDESVHEIDTAPILAAAARAVELWPDERPVDEGGDW